MVNFQPLSDTAANPTRPNSPIHKHKNTSSWSNHHYKFTNLQTQKYKCMVKSLLQIHQFTNPKKYKCTVNCRPLSYPTAHPVPPAPNHRLNRSASAHHSAADIIFAQFFPQLFTILSSTSSLPNFSHNFSQFRRRHHLCPILCHLLVSTHSIFICASGNLDSAVNLCIYIFVYYFLPLRLVCTLPCRCRQPVRTILAQTFCPEAALRSVSTHSHNFNSNHQPWPRSADDHLFVPSFLALPT